MKFKNVNKSKAEQTANASKYPQGYFKEKQCRQCSATFSPNAPSEHYCSDNCKDIGIHNRYLQRTYGITIEEYNRLKESQDNKCCICGTDGTHRASANKSTPLVVDHDHKTGIVRGLLCHTCNSALGQFNDSQLLLEAAVHYLDHNANIQPNYNVVSSRKTDLSMDTVLCILTDKLDNKLNRKQLEEKYNLSEAKIKGIVELKTQQAKKALERYNLIKESATTIPSGSTSQANGDGSGEHPFLGDDIV